MQRLAGWEAGSLGSLEIANTLINVLGLRR